MKKEKEKKEGKTLLMFEGSVWLLKKSVGKYKKPMLRFVISLYFEHLGGRKRVFYSAQFLMFPFAWGENVGKEEN